MAEVLEGSLSPSPATMPGLPKHGRLSVTMHRRPSVVNTALDTFDINTKRARGMTFHDRKPRTRTLRILLPC